VASVGNPYHNTRKNSLDWLLKDSASFYVFLSPIWARSVQVCYYKLQWTWMSEDIKGSGPHGPDAPRPSLDMGLTGFMVHSGCSGASRWKKFWPYWNINMAAYSLYCTYYGNSLLTHSVTQICYKGILSLVPSDPEEKHSPDHLHIISVFERVLNITRKTKEIT